MTSSASQPHLGLVCITSGPEVRFRTITRTRYLMAPAEERFAVLEAIYRDNIARLLVAASYCAAHHIRLYRLSSALFPMSDLPGDDTGLSVLDALSGELAAAGVAFRAADIRVLIHPDQFLVLSSENPEVVARSIFALSVHARVLDGLGMERSPWNCILLHGGKGGRGQALTDTILTLPEAVRTRFTLENDERAYGPADLLPVCEATGTPLIFDAHHHVVREKLASQEDPSVREWVLKARATWTPPEWQVVHLSSGIDGPQDRRHTDLITQFPSAYLDVPWIEVEAKGKELALADLRARLPETAL
ncbi:UV DNA damage repair endonuclease UvsE [Deinococcus ruber]|uniref:UV DNA damage endonuclease n=1 Tax=Deinococcus ruber TaxID=1848197 RepID=A0A918CBM0_9DEIO|nr:UV DNA damage repair endonuclease UvsE [Deinococcus ruber]GGR14489.1 UV DNA damage endonuclease [Deinococcus ruber]